MLNHVCGYLLHQQGSITYKCQRGYGVDNLKEEGGSGMQE